MSATLSQIGIPATVIVSLNNGDGFGEGAPGPGFLNGTIDSSGHLQLLKTDGSLWDAGKARPSIVDLGALAANQNLGDITSAAIARQNLGLGPLATVSAGLGQAGGAAQLNSSSVLAAAARPDAVAVPGDFVLSTDTNDVNSLAALFAAARQASIPKATYNLSGLLRPAVTTGRVTIQPGTIFSGGILDQRYMIPYIPYPLISLDIISNTYGAEWNGTKNIMQRASYAKSTVARGGSLIGPAVVANFAAAEAAGTGAAVWAQNLLGTSSVVGATSITTENDSYAAVPGAIAVNTLLAAIGPNPSAVALQIQANQPGGSFTNGIYFNNRQVGAVNGTYAITQDIPAVTGTLIYADNGTAVNGLSMPTMTFTGSAINVPGLIVGPTQVPGAGQYVSQIRIDSTLNNVAYLGANGGDGTTGVDLNIFALNGGNINLLTFNKAGPVGFQIKHVASADTYLQTYGSIGTDVTLKPVGAATNASVNLIGKGSGGTKLIDGGGSTKILINTTGIGFFGGGAVAQPAGNSNYAPLAAAGSVTSLFANSTSTGGLGSTAYTLGDIVYSLKRLNIIAN